MNIFTAILWVMSGGLLLLIFALVFYRRIRNSKTHPHLQKRRKVLLFSVGIVCVAGLLLLIGLSQTDMVRDMFRARPWRMVQFFGPGHTFDPSLAVPQPDYTKAASWAARPDLDDEADLVPKGDIHGDQQVNAKAAVFYMHPTSLYHGWTWNSELDHESQTGENVKWMLANQASIFNACCEVYAPYYRAASIFAYYAHENNAFEPPYSDILKAFDHFVTYYLKGRPFFLASHSQGTKHAMRLLTERIDGTLLAERLVAAYTIGHGVPHDFYDKLESLHTCTFERDINCGMHWATIGEGGAKPSDKPLCVNPLTWRRDTRLAEPKEHRGAVPFAGELSHDFIGFDWPKGISFDSLDAAVPAHTGARCDENGFLYVSNQLHSTFKALEFKPRRSFHSADFSLFYMDIRENAIDRLNAYLAQHELIRPGLDMYETSGRYRLP